MADITKLMHGRGSGVFELCSATSGTPDCARGALNRAQRTGNTLNRPAHKKRILYLQYTNPAGYPPLQHSSRMLAGAGWQVLFLGTASYGTDPLVFPPHPNIVVRRLASRTSRWRMRLAFLHFCVWVVAWCIRWRPRVVYASDLYSTPAAVLARPFVKTVIYHEHDTPQFGTGATLFQKLCRWSRSVIARQAGLCVIPNETRAALFQSQTRTSRPIHVVWNCPSVSEVNTAPRPDSDGLRVLYHGSIVPERLPLALMDALPRISPRVTLVVAGYETLGSAGYLQRLRNRAGELGCTAWFEYLGPKPRRELMEFCRTCDVGLSLMPVRARDVNMAAMTGASNKPFDYLSCGLPLLVSDLPEWKSMFIDAGYALACNPEDPDSIARAIQWYVDHPGRMRAMGEAGQRRIQSEWNYEAQFRPILDWCEKRL